MNYKIRFERNQAVLYNEYFSNISIEDIRESQAQRIKNPDRFKAIKIMVCDFINASMEKIVGSEVYEDKFFLEKMIALNPNLTFIAIVPNDLDYCISLLWKKAHTFISWDTHIVRSTKEAEELIESILQKH